VVEITDKNKDVYLLESSPDKTVKKASSEGSPSGAPLAIYAKCSSCFELGKLAFNC